MIERILNLIFYIYNFLNKDNFESQIYTLENFLFQNLL